MSTHAHDVRIFLQCLLHNLLSALLSPVTITHNQPFLSTESLFEPLMTLQRGRRVFQPPDNENLSSGRNLGYNITAHYPTHLQIVGSHKGSIFLGIGLAIEENHGNALVVGFVNYW